MRKRILLILVGIVLLAMVPGIVSAENTTTINFQNLKMLSTDSFDVYAQDYSGAWSLQGTYNTTSTLVFTPGNYNVVMRPSSVDVIDSPTTILNSVSDFVETNLVALIIGAFLVGIVLWRR